MSIVFEPIFGHYGTVFGRTNNDHFRVFREASHLMPKGDEGWIELIKSNNSHGDPVPDLKDALIVWNETFLTLPLHTDDVWQAMNEVLFDFTEGATYEVTSCFGDVELKNISIIFEIHHFFKVG